MAPRKEIEQDADIEELRGSLLQLTQLKRRKARAGAFALMLFAITSLVVVALSDLGPFHRYWSEAGNIAVTLWLVSLIWATFRSGQWWAVYRARREALTDLKQLLEVRYDVRA